MMMLKNKNKILFKSALVAVSKSQQQAHRASPIVLGAPKKASKAIFDGAEAKPLPKLPLAAGLLGGATPLLAGSALKNRWGSLNALKQPAWAQLQLTPQKTAHVPEKAPSAPPKALTTKPTPELHNSLINGSGSSPFGPAVMVGTAVPKAALARSSKSVGSKFTELLEEQDITTWTETLGSSSSTKNLSAAYASSIALDSSVGGSSFFTALSASATKSQLFDKKITSYISELNLKEKAQKTIKALEKGYQSGKAFAIKVSLNTIIFVVGYTIYFAKKSLVLAKPINDKAKLLIDKLQGKTTKESFSSLWESDWDKESLFTLDD